MKIKAFLLSLSVGLIALCYADSNTSRAGIVKPSIGATAWGTKTNSNWDIVDSSFSVLAATETFTGSKTFTNPTTFNSSVTVNSNLGVTGALSLTGNISAGSVTANNLSASQFVQTNSSKILVSYDLLNATQTWTAGQTFSSSITVSSNNYILKNSSSNSCGYLIGSVVQSSQAVDGTSVTGSGTGFTVTNTSATITPRCSTDKVRVTVTGSLEAVAAAASTAGATIFRGSTNLAVAGGTTFVQLFSGTAINITTPCSMIFLDSPATTSATTYTARINEGTNADTTWNPNSNQAVILLEEIAQ